jgi:hypothetical protein
MSDPVVDPQEPAVDPWLLSAIMKVTCADFDCLVVLSPNEYAALKKANLHEDRIACHKWAIDYLDRHGKRAAE